MEIPKAVVPPINVDRVAPSLSTPKTENSTTCSTSTHRPSSGPSILSREAYRSAHCDGPSLKVTDSETKCMTSDEPWLAGSVPKPLIVVVCQRHAEWSPYPVLLVRARPRSPRPWDLPLLSKDQIKGSDQRNAL